MTEIAIIILGIIAIIAILLNPYFGLMLFTALLYIRPMDFIPELTPFHITRLIGGLTIVALIFRKGSNKEPIFKNYTQLKLLSFLILFMLLSLTTSIWRGHSVNQIMYFFRIYIAFLLVINLVDTPQRFKGIVWVMILSGLFIGITSVASYFRGENLLADYRLTATVEGMFNDPNDLALCFVMLLPFVYYFFIGSKSIFKKIFLGICFIIFLLGIILTYSRGGALGLLGILIFLFLRTKNKIRATVGISLIIFLFFTLAPTKYVERIKTVPVSTREDDAVINRLDAWNAGISMMSHRLFGVGVGNFGEGFPIYRPEGAIAVSGKRQVAHNAFIQVGGETGIFGLAVFTILIFSSLKSLNSLSKNILKFKQKNIKEMMQFADATMLSLIGFIICAFFLSQAFNWILYYLIAFSVVLNELNKKMYACEAQ